MKSFLLVCTILQLVAGEAEPVPSPAIRVFLSLKEQNIPSDGTGVVILSDIGGYLGPADGLLCRMMIADHFNLNRISGSWSYPNGTTMLQLPKINVFGIDTCHTKQGVSLYYSGLPEERGLFQCNLELLYYSGAGLDLLQTTYNYTRIYIVDMNITGPTLDRPGEIAIAGESVELSISVITFPKTVPVPYQWKLNGTNLLASNSGKYQGTQNHTLTIFNVQYKDQGDYTCTVAHSASGIGINPIRLKILTIGVTVLVEGSTNNPMIGKSFTLSCVLSGIDILSSARPKYQYRWSKNGKFFHNSARHTYTLKFKPLKFSDAGNYECRGIATFSRRSAHVTASGISLPHSLMFSDVTYRIYLHIENHECQKWTEQNTKIKEDDIREQITNGINKCSSKHIKITKDIFNKSAFRCPKNPKSVVVYDARAYVYGNDQINTSILVNCLDEWIAAQKTITANDVELEINKDCTKVVNDNNNDYECAAAKTSNDRILAIAFGVISLVLLIIILVLVVYKIIVRCRNRNGYDAMRPEGQQPPPHY